MQMTLSMPRFLRDSRSFPFAAMDTTVAAVILSPLGNDPRPAFALAWTGTLVYVGTLLVTAAATLELRREKRSGRQLPPGLLRG